jgi:hypothetical protein
MSEQRNCFICAKEFSMDDLEPKSASLIEKYKICEGCISHANPAKDYAQVKEVIAAFTFKGKVAL